MRYIPYQQPSFGGAYYSSVPPTIGSIGGYGYNNMYFNPYYIRQQEEAQKRYEEEQRANQMNIWAKLGRCVNNCFGYEQVPKEQVIQQMQYDYQQRLQIMEDMKLANTCASIAERSRVMIEQERAREAQIEQQRQNPPSVQEPSGQDLFEWLRNEGSERYREALKESVKRNQRNTSRLYDSNGYHQLLQAHTSAFNSLNPNVTIDDMEIQVSLPTRLAQERDARRQAFINQITRGMG